MHNHYEEKILPHTPYELFSLVSDVKSYPSFLPWCSKAEIYEETKNHILAKLYVGKGPVTGAFTSHVFLKNPDKIEIQYKDGPLQYLSNTWTFIEKTDNKTKVCFDLDFEFKSSMLNLLMKSFFDQAFINIMTAFEDEAKRRFS